LSTKETQELLALAQKNKLFIMEAIWSRFLPSYEFVFDQIKKGVIGDILYVDATFGAMDENVERVVKKELGGGSILNVGVYTINIVEQVFNGEMPEKISAVGNLNADGVDLNCSAVLKFKNGRTATISTHSQIVLPNEAHIVGTKGTIKVFIY
jgi:dihydrodiol dehydrogenase / D-xylose 1-dehydrogenase (NADP)